MSRFLTRGLKGSLVITDLGMDRLAVNWSSITTDMFAPECIIVYPGLGGIDIDHN